MRALFAVTLAALALSAFASPVQAVPIALGEHGAGIFVNPGDAPLCCIAVSQSQTALDTELRTLGSGAAVGGLTTIPEGLTFRAEARVPGQAGSALAAASGQTLVTLTNTGAQTPDVVEVGLFEEVFFGFVPELGEIGVAALVDDPARETARWRSLFIASLEEAGPCFDPTPIADGGCALASSTDLRLDAPPSDFVQPDLSFRPFPFFLDLGPGESVSFWLTAQARAEAVRVPVPGILTLLGAGLAVIGVLARRADGAVHRA